MKTKDKLLILKMENSQLDRKNCLENNFYATIGSYDALEIVEIEVKEQESGAVPKKSTGINEVLKAMYVKRCGEREEFLVPRYVYALFLEQTATSAEHCNDSLEEPYTFAVMLNFQSGNGENSEQSGGNLEKRMCNIQNYIEEHWKAYFEREQKKGNISAKEEKPRFHYSFYYPLDSSDLLILFNTNSFVFAQTILKHMFSRPELEIAYSYTIFSIKKLTVQELEERILPETLSYAFIYFSITNFKAFETYAAKLWRSLGKSMPLKYLNLMGNYDAELVFENIKTRKLFPLYLEKGFLADDEDFRKAVYYSQTRLGVFSSVKVEEEKDESVEVPEEAAKIENIENKNKDTNATERNLRKYKENLKKQFEETKEKLKTMDFPMRDAFLHSLQEVYFMICSYGSEKVNNYIYYGIAHSFGMFLVELRTVALVEGDEYEINENRKFLYNYLNSVNCLIQSYTNSDRKLFQNPKIEQAMFDIPNKLGCFYSAVAYRVIELFKEIEGVKSSAYACRSTVLFCPSIYRSLCTYASFDEKFPPKNQILVIEAPEIEVFNVQRFIIQLVHEIAHYEGDAIRERASRKNFVIDIFCEILKQWLMFKAARPVKEQFNGLKAEERKPREQRVEEAVDAFNKRINLEIRRNLVEKEEISVEGESCHDYAKYLKRNLGTVITELLRTEIGESKLGEEIAVKFMDEDIQGKTDLTLVESYSIIQEVLLYTEDILLKYLTANYTEIVIESIVDIFSELFSDIASIYLLDIGPEEYLEMHGYDKKHRKEMFDKTDYVFHIILVSMIEIKEQEASNKWSKDFVEKSLEENYMRIVGEMLEGKDVEVELVEEQGLEYFYKYAVAKKYIEYVKICWESLKRRVEKNGDLVKERKKIQKIYEKSKGKNQEFIEISEEMIEWFWKYSQKDGIWGDIIV